MAGGEVGAGRSHGTHAVYSQGSDVHIDDRLEAGESIDTPESISLTSLEVAV